MVAFLYELGILVIIVFYSVNGDISKPLFSIEDELFQIFKENIL
jgi:hypothetical protein